MIPSLCSTSSAGTWWILQSFIKMHRGAERMDAADHTLEVIERTR